MAAVNFLIEEQTAGDSRGVPIDKIIEEGKTYS